MRPRELFSGSDLRFQTGENYAPTHYGGDRQGGGCTVDRWTETLSIPSGRGTFCLRQANLFQPYLEARDGQISLT